MNGDASENPYATTAATSDQPKRSWRWLAIVVSLISAPYAALVLLRRHRLAALWLGLTVLALALFANPLSARLSVVGLTLGIVIWLVSFVFVCIIAPTGEPWTTNQATLLAVALVIGPHAGRLAVRWFVMESFQIPADSMAPTLLVGDHVTCDKTTRRPARGDVIVFRYPNDVTTDYVKRVIGLPGETVTIANDVISVDGKPLERRRLDEPCAPDPRIGACALWEEKAGRHTYRVIHHSDRHADFGPAQVPANSVFVMGDNRDNSNDSRVWGSVRFDLVKCRTTAVWWSPNPRGGWRWDRFGVPAE